MLELRPNCEYCDKDLPPDAADARICTYECTFCADCVERVLSNVCPNCGGGFVPRPIRPQTERRPGVCLGKQPASTQRVRLKWDRAELAAFARSVRDVRLSGVHIKRGSFPGPGRSRPIRRPCSAADNGSVSNSPGRKGDPSAECRLTG